MEYKTLKEAADAVSKEYPNFPGELFKSVNVALVIQQARIDERDPDAFAYHLRKLADQELANMPVQGVLPL